jgi:hypothetical protein
MPYNDVEGAENKLITSHDLPMSLMMSRIFRKLLGPQGRHYVGLERTIMETISQRWPTGHNSKSVSR